MNKFQFLGRLTKDVEAKTTQNDLIIATYDIAVNRRYNNEQIKADFFKITSFGKLAEFCAKYYVKGQQVLVEGRIQNRTWKDDKGNTRYATDYIAEQCYFADSKREVKEENGEFVTLAEDEELPF